MKLVLLPNNPSPSPQIGWLPYRATRCGYAVQAVLVVVWFLCILATMATQALSCFKRDAVSKLEVLKKLYSVYSKVQRLLQSSIALVP